MNPPALSVCLVMVLAAGCGGAPAASGKPTQPSDVTGGTGGTDEGGSGGGSGGTAGSSLVDAATRAPGGAGGGPGGEGGGAPEMDAAIAADVAAGGEGGGSGQMLGFYEAEAVMPAGPNQLIAPAVVNGCPNASPNCGAPDTVKPETPCCFQGKEVRQLLRGKGGLQFNKLAAPADGMYDVTWYYHCGKNDNFGDGNCGGEPNHPAGGCRPHILTVNGTRLPKVYEFHCFPGPWGEIHIVTTSIPLKSGDNSLRVVATPGRDAADLDAIAIFPAGKGPMPQAFAH
jgi:hypothetical protein